MTLSTINKSWAVTQIAILVLATGGSAFPLVASANQSNHDNEQHQNNNHDEHEDHDNDQNDGHDNHDNQGNHDHDEDNNDHDNNGNEHQVDQHSTATVVATKIVCNNEADLPNWGNGSGAAITMTTATDYVAAHPNCHLTSGWNFQWAPDGTDNPGDNTGVAGTWTTFGPTAIDGTVSAQVPSTPNGVFTWFREVFQSGYVPFTGADASDDVSAEFYCDTDHTNYDNYDWIEHAQANHTYYCVAFNALLAPEDPTCTETQHLDNHVCVENAPVDPTCTETQHLDNHVCVDNSSTTETTTTTTTEGNGPFNIIAGGGGDSHGQVLGASCGLYMDKHIKFGSSKNDSEQVKKLQTFLNKRIGANLPVTGVYDSATLAAVKEFQTKYGSDILKPWNLGTPTGIVYLSTLRLINMLECPDLSLPLPALIPWSQNPSAQ